MELTPDNSFEIRKRAASTLNYGYILRFDQFSSYKDLTGFLFDSEAFRDTPELHGVLPNEHVYPQIILSPHPLPGLVSRYFDTPDDSKLRGAYEEINTASNYWFREAFLSGGFGLEVHDYQIRDLRKNIFMDDIEWLDRKTYVEGGRSKRHLLGAAATLFTNPLWAGVPYVLIPKKKVGAQYNMKLKGINEYISFTSLKIPDAHIYAGQVLELYVGPPQKTYKNNPIEKKSEDKSSEIEF